MIATLALAVIDGSLSRIVPSFGGGGKSVDPAVKVIEIHERVGSQCEQPINPREKLAPAPPKFDRPKHRSARCTAK
ncbi:hypothetical protein NDN01_20355 [Sphingomonas sp. QA11]|uniref:hypothetical protein n=1 Tax=Sphingomonas sp. QA11 TaxID=2950605 RepID=UPI00234B451C|nr:hypothetical protein [Sphingomonas sp. QA11]WCM26334.1 hypothetical protein NDN01_20355 [Sphingomonas sp. QA11]